MNEKIQIAWADAVASITEFEKVMRKKSKAHALEIRNGWDYVREAYEDFQKAFPK